MANLTNINNKFLVTTGGNVGIGTTSPSYKLDVNGSLRASSNIYAISTYALVLDSNEGSGPQLTFGSTSDTDLFGRIAQHASKFQFITQSRNFEWLNGSSSLMILQTNGNVGIGTTSPNKKLEILSTASDHLRLAFNSSAYWDLFQNAADGSFRILKDNGSLFTFAQSGNLGIGTDDPDYTLHLLKSSGDTEMYINGQNGQSSLRMGLDARNWQIKTAAAPYLWSLNYVGTDLPLSNIITANVGGNVGIGTASPDVKLEINGGADAIAKITGTTTAARFDYKTNSHHRFWQLIESDGRFRFYDQTNGSERLTIENSGNVGIGTTSPASKLSINAGVAAITAGPTVRISKGASPVGSIAYDTLVIEADDVPTIRFGENDGTVSTIMSGDSNLRINSTSPIKFYTAGTTTGPGHSGQSGTFAMIINNSQNVGIGTTAPSSKLTVSGGDPDLTGVDNSIRIENHTSANASPNQIGNGIVFAQKWWSGSASLRVTGGIYGIKTAGNGTFGGGLAFYTQPSSSADIAQRMVIDSSGNVGIGTTSPTADLSVGSTSTSSGDVHLRTTKTTFSMTPSNTDAGGIFLDLGFVNGGQGPMKFGIGGAERMRITSGGEVLVGVTSTLRNNKLHVNSSNFVAGFNVTNGTGEAVAFFSNGTVVGTISVTGSATAYNTSSDYRLKEDLKDFAGLDMVSKISVYDFKWKSDENRSYGVMAHELQEVLPNAVSGDKDAEEMQGVDYSKIVPLLVKSIQELEAKIKILENK